PGADSGLNMAEVHASKNQPRWDQGKRIRLQKSFRTGQFRCTQTSNAALVQNEERQKHRLGTHF
ncbi:hypothetical protein, partial [Pseudomonas brenneri]|uniref:hypothetical protein n=1 Tax=Pseudomonas brenneri TaxID=129817 RepID=UPI001E61A63F